MTEVDENTSDGYHTFKELYEHRHALYVALVNSRFRSAVKSYLHHDMSMMEGRFIVQLELASGQVSYHLPNHLWNKVRCKEQARANERDGHTPADVVARLLEDI